jgi:putative Ca2+/H+ antiporter (TMEM165/GDT1 family)
MACPLSWELHGWLRAHVFQPEVLTWLTTAGTSFALIGAAEIGDKSQLVCMTLSSRHRAAPVFLGALAAFVVLNLLAVAFGASIAKWISREILLAAVACLFAAFGLVALFARGDGNDESLDELPGHGVFTTTFLMILLAEFGDKTQLATAGLSVGSAAGPVWFGSTLALALTSLLAVVAGRTMLQRIPVRLLHRASGLLFLALAGVTLSNLLSESTGMEWRERLFRVFGNL